MSCICYAYSRLEPAAFSAAHTAGHLNAAADAMSRLRLQEFRLRLPGFRSVAPPLVRDFALWPLLWSALPQFHRYSCHTSYPLLDVYVF